MCAHGGGGSPWENACAVFLCHHRSGHGDNVIGYLGDSDRPSGLALGLGEVSVTGQAALIASGPAAVAAGATMESGRGAVPN